VFLRLTCGCKGIKLGDKVGKVVKVWKVGGSKTVRREDCKTVRREDCKTVR